MSAKRKPDETCVAKEINECSDCFPCWKVQFVGAPTQTLINLTNSAVLQEENNIKRAKHASLSDTITLHNLPTELLAHILIEVVTAEVEEEKLAKTVWKEKADHVIDRLRTVCSQWSSVVTTDFFRNKVHGILESTAEKTIRLEVLQQSSIDVYASAATAIKDELFVLWKKDYEDHRINVYDRSNMKEVKCVMRLGPTARNPETVSACRVSNCLYILDSRPQFQRSVLRITKADVHNQFNVSVVFSVPWVTYPSLAVTTNGDLVLFRHKVHNRALISVYDANGALRREMKMSMDFYALDHIFPKSNGNIVLVSRERFSPYTPQFTEIDMHGTILRQSLSTVNGDFTVFQADSYGRMLLVRHSSYEAITLLDSEFNLLDFVGPKLDGVCAYDRFIVDYNVERNEVVRVFRGRPFTIDTSDVLFFCITDE